MWEGDEVGNIILGEGGGGGGWGVGDWSGTDQVWCKGESRRKEEGEDKIERKETGEHSKRVMYAP